MINIISDIVTDEKSSSSPSPAQVRVDLPGAVPRCERSVIKIGYGSARNRVIFRWSHGVEVTA